MKIIADDKEIIIKGYKSLNQDTGDAFLNLFTAFLNDPERDYGNLIENLYPPFEQKFFDYFDNVAKVNSRQQNFISNLTIVWNQYLIRGEFG